jgi:hypothetical protein
MNDIKEKRKENIMIPDESKVSKEEAREYAKEQLVTNYGVPRDMVSTRVHLFIMKDLIEVALLEGD